ncbi:MAG TPA: hypothetical protein VJR29_11695 [bacterium]|nr:hypothetical protein [bacterium]
MVAAREYFEYVQAAFLEAAARAQDGRRVEFRLGPANVAFRFANSALLSTIMPPFAHLPPSDPASQRWLSVDLWDGESSGIVLKPPPMKELHGGRVYLGEGRHSVLYDYHAQILCLYDAEDRHAIFWTPRADTFPYFESVSPLRVIFDWFFTDSSLQMMHAGSVGTEKGALLLVGKGGSGKSTTCSLAFRSELSFLGDDFCLVDSAKPRVYSLYASSKLCPDVVDRFPELKPAQNYSPRHPEEKATFLLAEKFSSKIPASLPLKAVVVPRLRDSEESSFRPAKPMEALTALAPSTVFILSRNGDHGFKKSAELLRRVPSYTLELGRNFSGVTACLVGLLDQL